MISIFTNKDIKYFSLYSFLSCFVFETPIFVMYLAAKGISYGAVSFLFSIYALTVIVFEYVTGVLADKYSRKIMLIIAAGSLIAGELCFVAGNNFPVFVAGMLFMALSTASRSGVDIAFLYDKLEEIGRKEDFDVLLSKLSSIQLVIAAVACIIGSLATKMGMVLPFLGTIVFTSVSILMLVRCREPRIHTKEANAGTIVSKSVKIAFGSRPLVFYLLLSLLIFPCYHLLNQFLQPYLKISGVSIEFFGIFYTVFSLFQAVGTRFSTLFIKKFQKDNALFGFSFLVLLGFLLMSLPRNWMAYLMLAFMGIAFGAYYNINNIVVNAVIKSEIRASLLSLQHTLTKIVQMLLFGVFGFVINESRFPMIFYIFSIIMLMLVLVLLLIYKKFAHDRKCECGRYL